MYRALLKSSRYLLKQFSLKNDLNIKKLDCTYIPGYKTVQSFL